MLVFFLFVRESKTEHITRSCLLKPSKVTRQSGVGLHKSYLILILQCSLHSDVVILRNPSYLNTATFLKRENSKWPTMHCEASNYDLRRSVVWVHDGTYIDNGPPPAGFTLHFHPYGESQRLPIELQGYYHCEVWGQGHLRKVASTKAFLRFNGKAVLLY